jgi:hypothetical protein
VFVNTTGLDSAVRIARLIGCKSAVVSSTIDHLEADKLVRDRPAGCAVVLSNPTICGWWPSVLRSAPHQSVGN